MDTRLKITIDQVQLLGDECKPYHVLPSEKIYHKTYIYRLIVVPPGNIDARIIKHEIIDFLSQYGEGKWFAQTKQMRFFDTIKLLGEPIYVYFDTKDDLVNTLKVFGGMVHSISGPVNKEHKNLLLEPDFQIDVDDTFYNLHNHNCSISIWDRSPFKTVKGRSERAEAFDFIICNLTEYEFKQYDVHLYCMFDDVIELLPFFKLAFPNCRILVTKRYLSGDKYNV